MGWSCTRKAGDVLRAISDVCYAQTGFQNTFKVNNCTYFFETGKENRDGAITGAIQKELLNGLCHKSGTFRIEPDGTMSRGPKFMKDIANAKNIGAIDSSSQRIAS